MQYNETQLSSGPALSSDTDKTGGQIGSTYTNRLVMLCYTKVSHVSTPFDIHKVYYLPV